MYTQVQQDDEILLTRSLSSLQLIQKQHINKHKQLRHPLAVTSSLNIQSNAKSKILKNNKEGVFYFQNKKQDEAYYVSKLLRNYENKDSNIMKHLISSWKIFKQRRQPPPFDHQMKKIFLPQSQKHRNKKTLIFDLDQTLIHSTKNQDIICDLRILMNFPSGQIINAGVNVRPYAIKMLQNLSQSFQIIIFTASYSFYADPILNTLDPHGRLFHHRLYREHCTEISKNSFVKDLRIIPRQLSQMVLIDNAPISYAYQPDNGIPILSYYYGKDIQLKELQTYLLKLNEVEDVRTTNNQTFKISKYSQIQEEGELIPQLFLNSF